MKILIVSATCKEINVLREIFQLIRKEDVFFSEYTFGEKQIDILLTGVGMTSTAYRLGRLLASKNYDFAFNFGIAGAFQKNFKIGDVLNVTSEIITELGAQNGDSFLKFNQLNMSERTMMRTIYSCENENEIDIPVIQELRSVRGITVNTVHGKKDSIDEIEKRFSPDVESMEGAVFLYACNQEKIRCAQIRSVSNYVEERNLENWNTALAIKNLNEAALEIISSLK